MPGDSTRIRQIMYQPSAVWLCTENSGDRWLTDQYVLLNVSDVDVFAELPDGPYKIMAKGEINERDSAPAPDIEAYFANLEDYTWPEAVPSEWSVAEHPGRAMLWKYADRWPCLLGESTWTQIKRHHPDVEVGYSKRGNLFRFGVTRHGEDCGSEYTDGECICWGVIPFCYAAGIQIPEGQERVAHGIAALLDSTRNRG